MNNPFFWLGVSILLVAISLMALLTVAIFTLQELARAARSAEKLLDTLNQELPATLRDLRLTGQDLSGLTDEVAGSVQSARSVVEQVDKGLTEAKVQAQKAQITTRSLFAGASAALRVLAGKPRRRRRPPTRRPPIQPMASVTQPVSTPENPAPIPTDLTADTESAKTESAKTESAKTESAKTESANSQESNHISTTEKTSTRPTATAKTVETPVIPGSKNTKTTS